MLLLLMPLLLPQLPPLLLIWSCCYAPAMIGLGVQESRGSAGPGGLLLSAGDAFGQPCSVAACCVSLCSCCGMILMQPSGLIYTLCCLTEPWDAHLQEFVSISQGCFGGNLCLPDSCVILRGKGLQHSTTWQV
jgi:hypothetical protein